MTTTRSRSLRTISGLFIALVLTASVAACAKTPDLPTGDGRFGDSPIGQGAGGVNTQPTPETPPDNPGNAPDNPGNAPDDPDNAPDDPGNAPDDPGNAPEEPANPPENPAEDAPDGDTGDPAPAEGSIVIPIDPGVLLLWPSPADCVSHNPATVSIKYTASVPLWQVVDGNHYLLAYKREVDAQAGLALAKAYKKHCFIGRDNTRPDRKRYIMDYWLEPVQASPSIANPDCIPHNPANLSIADLGPTGWRVEEGSQAIALFDTKEDAQQAVLVMKHYNRNCYIGRGYAGADRLEYITDWFANG